ncbi:hypothetical protein TNCV_3180401 [Trichonephila clavipes]|uniref:Uncharacterized protein n=1 Tax=Trichonephila clavipes TaxID=2585209 RepID=A0A8X6RJI3_TRICX|nr:hypothetical protein TNCV_3180401 [Trichonephila clavipes]
MWNCPNNSVRGCRLKNFIDNHDLSIAHPDTPTRLKSFTNDNNFINPNQYGFTRNLSTYHPLLGLTEKITAGFQRGRSTGAVFLDIKKGFRQGLG